MIPRSIKGVARRVLGRIDPRRAPLSGELSERPLRIVFHHQPKTAGSTFREYLNSLFLPQHVSEAEIDDELYAMTPEERDGYRLFAGHLKYETIVDLFPDCLWLVLLRHPVERVISNYYNVSNPARYQPQWIRRAQERPHVQKYLERVQKMSLEQFVHDDDWRSLDRTVNRQTRYLMPKRPKEERFLHYDEGQLEEAKRNLREQFFLVGVQEQFEKTAAVFNSVFGVRQPFDPSVHNRNINEKKTSMDSKYDIGSDLRKRLEDMNRMDIEIWEYANKLLDEQAIRAGVGRGGA